jgi:hypothetical protein
MPSSVVQKYYYLPEKQTLRVVFVSGLVYDYKDVPEEVYRQMKAAFSKGEFLNREIKNKYAFEKVE